MKIIPAIDLIDSRCVRLKQGSFASCKIYSQSPLAMARTFAAHGLKFLHVVDLEGARTGQFSEYAVIESLVKSTSLTIQVGGGIRTHTIINNLFNAGVDRVVLGSLVVSEREQVAEWLTTYTPQKIILAVDIRHDKDQIPWVMTGGWQQRTQCSLWDLLAFYSCFSELEILCTDIAKDGLLKGPNFELYQEANERFPHMKWLISGGITTLTDVKYFSERAYTSGIIIGKALFEGKIILEDLANVS